MTHREPTEIDALAERFVDATTALQPESRVYRGSAGDKTEYQDYSPNGVAALGELYAATRRELADLEAVDDVDVVTKLDLDRVLELGDQRINAGWYQRDLNNLASPLQEIRDIFDLMPTDSDDDWHDIAGRMANVGGAVDGYIASLREGLRRGNTPAARQVEIGARQLDEFVAGAGFFHDLAGRGAAASGVNAGALTAGAEAATESFARLRGFLSDELAPEARTDDAVGRDLYELASREFLGARIDLDEYYEWGIEELERMRVEQEAIAREILPGATVAEAIAHLEERAEHRLNGTDELQRWMQRTADEAVAALNGTHFDIPEPVQRIECVIAPTQTGGIYYTGPSDDFSRAGRMWWSVPEGVTEFDTWRELTTVYHEGVPGHHLQIGQAVYLRDSLNSWRREAWTSGHGEGWALYAEQLMDQLGYLTTPADRLGMLDGQRMRAARVVLDIGVHLGKQMPGGGAWTFESALQFMSTNVNMTAPFVKFEVERYFGWPGQAPAYKIGQRVWEDLRDEIAQLEGDRFDLKEFHRRALGIGGCGLDTLRTAVRRLYTDGASR
ncbi:DUF885 domain-containing protein [Gulosibacter sp. ACHW.36C]|uniref:DUF885 domain-containing protein n=1 Tax=Gulosibacter sediminis TaxID=1729695 RepID=A0ABY4MXP6_9MICO|nr:DUF885 domain-containing protein [Gulosibacter sediminis]UQN13768.1 DUF885 domain-containing protein [Gulosibacter sediminis]